MYSIPISSNASFHVLMSMLFSQSKTAMSFAYANAVPGKKQLSVYAALQTFKLDEMM